MVRAQQITRRRGFPLGVLPLSTLSTRFLLAIASTVALAACEGRPPPSSTPTPSTCAACQTGHPLDELLSPAFAALGHEPVVAASDALCTRLAFDLVGRPLRSAEQDRCVASIAAGDVDAAVVELQGTDDYLLQSQRFWADRIATNDVVVDFRATVDLYHLVDDVQRGTIRYDEFVVAALKHPGLINADFGARERVRRVFQAILVRQPNEAEEIELSSLWKGILADFNAFDPELPIRRTAATVLPGFCRNVGSCSTDLWGGAEVDFSFVPANQAFVPLFFDDLPAEIDDALRAPGELFARQPEVYEAEVDALLDRFLDWDEGAREIQRPGHLFPEVRAHLAAILQDEGSLPDVERLILTSLMYTQRADVDDGVSIDDTASPDHPLRSGPVKALSAEAFMSTMQGTTSLPFASCDPRFADGFSYSLVYQAYSDGQITGAQYNNAINTLFALREDRGRLQEIGEVADDGTSLLGYDYGFIFIARNLGGCPGFGSERRRPEGVAFASVQDSMVQIFCQPALLDRVLPVGRPDLGEITASLFETLLQRTPTPADLDDVVAATGCDDIGADTCAAEVVASRVCAAIAGSSEMMFR